MLSRAGVNPDLPVSATAKARLLIRACAPRFNPDFAFEK